MDLGDHAGGRRGEWHPGLGRREFGRLIPEYRGRRTEVGDGRLGGRPEVVEVASHGKILVARTGLPTDRPWEGRGKGRHGEAGHDGLEWCHGAFGSGW